MPDMMSEIIRTVVTTLITTAGGIIGALLIRRIREDRNGAQRKRLVSIGAFSGLGIGVILGITLAIFWPTGDECLRARISAPLGTKNNAHAAANQVEHEIPISWTPPNGERCVMTVQSYQHANPIPIRDYKNVVSGTILDIGNPGSGETEIKIWVEGYNTPIDNTWVWIK